MNISVDALSDSVVTDDLKQGPERAALQTQAVYATGGRQRSRLLKSDEEYCAYEKAVICELDPTGTVPFTSVEYDTPPECRPDGDFSVLFKGASINNRELYICTATEVLIFELPEFRIVRHISLPCFNDLHYVCARQNGNLLVVNTGLDMVVECTRAGGMVRCWNVLGSDPWERFSPTTDYRKIISTKPHWSHPNYVFELDNEIWATRHNQRDAISLSRPGRRIEIKIEKPHDGILSGDHVLFTTVDCNLVHVNRKTLRVDQVTDLKTIDNEEKALLGWCRGLMAVDEHRVWVGFTRVHKTRFLENVNWVKHVFRDVEKPTHIALYDIATRKCLQEIDLEGCGINVVFSILRAFHPLNGHTMGN
jgi:hypothetical protein